MGPGLVLQWTSLLAFEHCGKPIDYVDEPDARDVGHGCEADETDCQKGEYEAERRYKLLSGGRQFSLHGSPFKVADGT